MSTGVAAKLVKDLKTEVATFQAETFSDNTKWTYATHRNSYFDFCAKLGIPPELASQEMIAMYAAYLAKKAEVLISPPVLKHHKNNTLEGKIGQSSEGQLVYFFHFERYWQG